MSSPQSVLISATDKYEPIRELQRQQIAQDQSRFPQFDIPPAAPVLDTPSAGTIRHPGFGTRVESVGKISEIFAQCGKISVSTDCLDGVTESLPFTLWDVTYGTHRLDTNDLTNLFLPGDMVAFAARVEKKVSGGSSPSLPPSGLEYWYRIIDVARIGEHTDDDHDGGATSRMILEEGLGTVVAVKEDQGVIKSERWGYLTFSRDALEVQNQHSSTLPVYKLVRSGRTVRYRCCSRDTGQKEWTVIAVTPNGEILSGQGRVVLIREKFGFVHSEEFGDIYVPFQAIRVPKDRIHQMKQAKVALFKALKVGTEVNFQITKSLPHGSCRWRAVSIVARP